MSKRLNSEVYLALAMVIVCTVLLTIPVDATIIYVDLDATGGASDGTSWGDAFVDLQDALAAADSLDEIWVSAGTYKPTTGYDRDISFNLILGVGLYGGFIGTETSRSERDWQSNVTILSGDIGVPGDSSDNSFHVVRANSYIDVTTELNGFTITLGNGYLSHDGGGMANMGSPKLINLIFINNSAYAGGGMYNRNIYFIPGLPPCSPMLANVAFIQNYAHDRGGAISNKQDSDQPCNPMLLNVTFSQNSAAIEGGAMANSGATPTLINCIMWDNECIPYPMFKEIFNEGCSPIVSYSLIEGCSGGGTGWPEYLGTDGGNNIDADPLFVDAAAGNLRLSGSDSPAVNVGTIEVLDFPATDLDGNRRISGGNVDMGAYEYQLPCSGPVVYVNASASGTRDGSSWLDAFTELSFALEVLFECPNVEEAWVAAGTYKPTSSLCRLTSFVLVDGKAVYGGFSGTETSRSERDWMTNVTILSGDIGVPNDSTDNSYHVVKGSGTDNHALLDGFTITDGYANGDSIYAMGGGMYNNGACDTLMNIIISNNYAYYSGGGMYNNNGRPILTNVVFLKNAAINGGGMYNVDGSNPILTNVTFSKNLATNDGGGVYNSSSTPTLINTILWDDLAVSYGNEIHNLSSAPLISYSLIEGSGGSGIGWDGSLGSDGGFNLDTNPLFIDAAGDNLRLSFGSPAEDAGDNTATNLPLTDLDGNPRILPLIGGIVDMGAYETDLPVCDITPLSLDFGTVVVGDSLDITFTIENVGSGILTGSVSSSCPYYTIASTIPPEDPYDLANGEQLVVTVRYKPTVEGGPFECDIETGVYLCSDVPVAGFGYACPIGNVLFVDKDASGAGDGSSWIDAFTELRDALVMAPQCPTVTEIWVAEGIYKPTAATDREATFQLQDNLAVYGGFNGTETILSERDWVANVTILSGDIGAIDDITDNSYHVVTSSGTDATAVLDGFTITKGMADGFGSEGYGGGMYNLNSNPTVSNVIISGNSADNGGGMYNSGSSPSIINVIISANSVSLDGGGIYSTNGSNPTFVNVLIAGNSSDNISGGMKNFNSNPTLVNVTFSDNFAALYGSGMFNNNSNPILTNTILWGDSATVIDTEIYNLDSAPTVSYSCIEGGLPDGCIDAGNNVYANPMFIDSIAGNYRLGVSSLAINAGTNDAIPLGVTTDLDGNDRIIDGIVDMGAYEDPWIAVPRNFIVSPSSIDFDPIAVGDTLHRTFVINNVGGGILDGNVSNTCSYFSIESGGGPFSLAPGDSLVVDILYEPLEAGIHECSIETNCSQLALVADRYTLQIIDVGDPAAMTLTGFCGTPDWAYGVYDSGDYAFVADKASGLQVIDISNPAAPTIVGTYDTPGSAADVHVSGDHAYVGDASLGLQVIDISDPAAPTLASSYDTPDYCWGAYVSGDHAFVADRESGLLVINISNPTAPTLVGTYDTPGFAVAVHVSGDHAFVGDHSYGLQMINISNPSAPTLVGTCDTPGFAFDVYVSGDYAFVADYATGLQVIDINQSSPMFLTIVGAYDTPGNALGVFVSGDKAFVADDASGLQAIDISNPTIPTLAGTYSTAGDNASGVTVIPWGSVACTGYAGYAHAVIDSIVDVPDDQGGWVRIYFKRSFYDDEEEATYPIERYDIHQRIDDSVLMAILLTEGEPIDSDLAVTLASGDVVRLSVPSSEDARYLQYDNRYFLEVSSGVLAAPPGIWEVVATVSAQQQNQYIARVSTVADDTMSYYYISAHTTTPSVFFDSPVGSGYSVDNIAPGVPLGFTVAYNTGSGNQLTWDPSPELDFQYYRIYRGDTEDFIPTPGNLVHETATESWSDPEYDGWNVHYKITALDYTGNESEAASPESVTGDDVPSVPKAFALYQNIPNPFNPTTTIRFDLPRSVQVKLSIYNVKGELIATLVDQRMSEGRKEIAWAATSDQGGAVASGIYFYRLVAGDFVQTRKMVLLR